MDDALRARPSSSPGCSRNSHVTWLMSHLSALHDTYSRTHLYPGSSAYWRTVDRAQPGRDRLVVKFDCDSCKRCRAPRSQKWYRNTGATDKTSNKRRPGKSDLPAAEEVKVNQEGDLAGTPKINNVTNGQKMTLFTFGKRGSAIGLTVTMVLLPL